MCVYVRLCVRVCVCSRFISLSHARMHHKLDKMKAIEMVTVIIHTF